MSIPHISPKSPAASIGPLVFVIFIGLLREGYEDYKRHKYDNESNNTKTLMFNQKTMQFEDMEWKNLKVGSIVKIQKNELIPADLLVIKSSELSGYCYVQTANLDGETALKSKEAAICFSRKISNEDYSSLNTSIVGYLEIDQPNENIYKAEGRVEFDSGEKRHLDINNIILRSCVLKNVEFVIGIVVYSGHDSKIIKNIKKYSLKMSSIEKVMNKIVIIMMILTFLISIICSFFGLIFRVSN